MKESMAAWIGIGANLGNRGHALALIRGVFSSAGLTVTASRELVTRAVGFTAQPDFLNQVLLLESPIPLSSQRWLQLCGEAEMRAGRKPTFKWGPRRGDADILLFERDGSLRVDEGNLTVPHPQLINRPFFCALVNELSPGLRHPDGWLFSENAGRFSLDETTPPSK